MAMLRRLSVYINHDAGMTLTYFTARSTKVGYTLEWENMGNSHLMGKIAGN